MLNVTIDVSGMDEALAELQKKVNNAQAVLTNECKAAADKFTPEKDSHLKINTKYTFNEHGIEDGWYYEEPYARRQWWGITESGKFFNYSLLVNDKARRRWTEHAAEVAREDIMRKVKAEFEK